MQNNEHNININEKLEITRKKINGLKNNFCAVKNLNQCISVICACKNRNEFLEQSLPTWLEHPEINEIIIIDWDSNPTVYEVVQKYKDKRIIIIKVENQPRWVLTKAYNLAARFVSGNKILKLDSDIKLSKNFFSNHYLEEGSFYAGNYKFAREPNEKHLNGVVFLHKKDFYEANGYNEDITTYGWDDSDLYYRLQNMGLAEKNFYFDSLYHIPHDDGKRLLFQPEVNNCGEEIKKNIEKFENKIVWGKNRKATEFIIRNSNYENCYIAKEIIRKEISSQHESKNIKPPKVSIISSIFKGDIYIENFLKDITRQTSFNECELIIINSNSPGNEETIIRDYMKKFQNIVYRKLPYDPGLYECWNIAIRMSSGKYITNANLDDRRAPTHIEKHVKILDKEENVDAVSAPLLVTNKINETWERNNAHTIWFKGYPEYFTGKNMFKIDTDNNGKVKINSQNILHCMPIWRKSLHNRYGFFDEANYGASADWEFWLRCAEAGSRYKLLREPLGIYLVNPESYNRKPETQFFEKRIISRYYPIKKTIQCLISDKHKIIYINNPKCACNSIKESLGTFFGVPQDTIEDWKKGVLKKHEDSKTRLAKIDLSDYNYRNYFKFTFVRNPWDRVLSAYYNKISQKTRHDNHSINELIKYFGKDDISFKEFVEFIKTSGDYECDPHWRSQKFIITDENGRKIANFIGKFENLEEDFKLLCHMLNITFKKLPHLVKTEHLHYSLYYDKQIKEDILNRYYEDIKYFNYRFEENTLKKEIEVNDTLKKLNLAKLESKNLKSLSIKQNLGDFSYFSYSKNEHWELLISDWSKLYKDEIDQKKLSLKAYQDLLILRFIIENLPKGSKILDIGGGSSRIIQYFKKDYECWNLDKLEGIGHGPKEINVSGFKLVKDYIGNFSKELPDNYFDLVFSISVLEHVTYEDHCLHQRISEDIDRVLKPGGYSVHLIDGIMKGGNTNLLKIVFQLCKNLNLDKLWQRIRNIKEDELPDVWYMPKESYNTKWKKLILKEYEEFGKPFSWNIFIKKQNVPNTIPIKFNLITTLYNEENEARAKEYISCLENNLNNPLINEIHIFYDASKDSSNNKILEFIKNKKIKIAFIKSRPTYRELFEYANKIFPNSKVIIANGDIFFNKTIGLLKDIELKNTMLALTRWNVLENGELEFFSQIKNYEVITKCKKCSDMRFLYKQSEIYECNDNPICWKTKNCSSTRNDITILPGRIIDWTGYSQDAWIFETPFPIKFKCDFKIGTFRCDSFLNYHLFGSGLKIYNPSKDIQCCHLHLSNLKSEDNVNLKVNDKQILLEEIKKGNKQLDIPVCSLQDIKNPRIILPNKLSNMIGFEQKIRLLKYRINCLMTMDNDKIREHL
jgi:GT2 family glycosyltransferase/ubiquinone/menaquinone biosynthesis C-methylase UbiE